MQVFCIKENNEKLATQWFQLFISDDHFKTSDNLAKGM